MTLMLSSGVLMLPPIARRFRNGELDQEEAHAPRSCGGRTESEGSSRGGLSEVKGAWSAHGTSLPHRSRTPPEGSRHTIGGIHRPDPHAEVPRWRWKSYTSTV